MRLLMMKTARGAGIGVAWAVLMFLGGVGAACAQSGPEHSMTPRASGYAPVNGIKLYYEVYGSGTPLVLLHGGLGEIEMFGPVIPGLAAHSEVIAVDLQGHGRTADTDRPLSYETMADDVAALIAYLGIGRADVMGYSLGGGVALQVAIRHRDVVNKLVLVSTAFRRDGWYPEVLAGEAGMSRAAAEQMKQTPMYNLYAALAPRPEDWPILVEKEGELLQKPYDWTAGVRKLNMPLLIVAGDRDAVRLDHTMELFGMFGGGKHAAGFGPDPAPAAELAILPHTTHFDIFMSNALVAAVVPFLDSRAGSAN